MAIYVALGITLVFMLLGAWFMSVVLVRKAQNQGEAPRGESAVKGFLIVLAVLTGLGLAVLLAAFLSYYALGFMPDLAEKKRQEYTGLIATAAFFLFLLLPGFLRRFGK